MYYVPITVAYKNKLGNYFLVFNPTTRPMKEVIYGNFASIHGKINQLKNLEYFYSLSITFTRTGMKREN